MLNSVLAYWRSTAGGFVEKYVFVSGGSRGIGRAIVVKFASMGFHVVFSYNTRRDMALKTLEATRGLPGRVEYVQLSLESPESIERVASYLEEKIPYLNVLVNNAGILHVGRLEETKPEDIDRVFRVNVIGVFLLTKRLLPLLEKAPWASVVNITSIAGQTGNITASALYAASKAAIIGFTRRLAVELAPKIRVNAVAPSFTDTDMVRDFMRSRNDREKIASLHPLRDIARPEDVAEAVYFLADPEHSRFITGQVLGVNGGRFTGC